MLDKWFAVQAGADRAGLLRDVRALTEHADFTWSNPNRLRSVVAVFADNMEHFHADGGEAYTFIGDIVSNVDRINPQIAARLTSLSFALHGRYDAARGALMRAQLQRIMTQSGVSKDTFEVCARALSAT